MCFYQLKKLDCIHWRLVVSSLQYYCTQVCVYIYHSVKVYYLSTIVPSKDYQQPPETSRDNRISTHQDTVGEVHLILILPHYSVFIACDGLQHPEECSSDNEDSMSSCMCCSDKCHSHHIVPLQHQLSGSCAVKLNWHRNLYWQVCNYKGMVHHS